MPFSGPPLSVEKTKREFDQRPVLSRLAVILPARKRLSFECFSYVCPEPVLVK
jgi:hypothetical protein